MAQHTLSLLGLHLNAGQLAALAQYEKELLEWNSRINLTAICDKDEIETKHFLDSLTCFQALKETNTEKIIDIGTGAGFPGIPLKIILPSMQLTLVESIGKKADFCRHIVNVLRLEGVEIIQERAEVIGRSPHHRENYDWAIARAVAILPTLSEYLLPLTKVGGHILAMKGESGPAEAHASERAMRVLGGHLRQLISLTLPGVVEERYLVIADKIAATPETYPRRVGIAQKRPL